MGSMSFSPNLMNMPGMMANMQSMQNSGNGGINQAMMLNQFSQMSQMNLNQLMRLCGSNPQMQQMMFSGGIPMSMNISGMQGMASIGGIAGMPQMGMMGQMPQQMPMQNTQKPPQNLFSEHVKSVLIESNKEKPKKMFPLKRASYHAAISYTIYLDRLKKEGVSLEKLTNLEEIDPTRHARRVKTQSGKSKDPQKKKK